jgi:hypothetical protein
LGCGGGRRSRGIARQRERKSGGYGIYWSVV